MSGMIYADNAAATPLSKGALEAMLPFFEGGFGNPSALYSAGRQAKRAVERARVQIAEAIGAYYEEVYFTSGGTEGANWAISAAAEREKAKGRHIISSAVEHKAVLSMLKTMEERGYEVTYLGVNEKGAVSPEELHKAIRPDTILISIMYANNEIGTIQPLEEIRRLAKKYGVLFHTDAVQAAGHIPLDVKALGADFLSFSAHKFYGPKGVGGLYIKKGIKTPPYMPGGGQERGLRGGTENVPGIIGMAAALKECVESMPGEIKRLSAMRDRLIQGVLKIPESYLIGEAENRLPGSASFVFSCVEGEALILLLDQAGICASSGSACSSGSLEPSHVLAAMGIEPSLAGGALRLTLGRYNTEEDVNSILQSLPDIIEKIREKSPLWDREKRRTIK